MIRKKAAQLTRRSSNIIWRSHEPSRLETFSDAVFGFALTLIIVSIEVPQSFSDLLETMRGTLSFAACFAALFQVWNSQNIFFRRYGLRDDRTVALNAILMFVVLIYAYPLKFLSILLLQRHTYLLNGHILPMIFDTQVPTLMMIYGAGFSIIYLLFALMHFNALQQKNELNMTPVEVFETQTLAYINMICFGIGITSITLAALLPLQYTGFSGFTYFFIPVAYSVWYSYRGKKGRKLFKTATN